MQKKTVTLLAGTAGMCVLFGTYFALKVNNEKVQEKASEESQKETITEIETADITKLTFQIGEDEAVFEKEEEEWKYAADEAFPVNSAQIDSVLGCLAPLEAIRTLEDITDISEYGLDEPQNIVTVTDSGGIETVVTIGDMNSGTGNDYVMLGEDSGVVYTTSTSLRNEVSKELLDYASSDEVPYVMASSITGISVSRGADIWNFYLEDDIWTEGDGSIAESEMEMTSEREVAAETETETAAENETETETETETESEGPSGMTASEIQTAVSSVGSISYVDYLEYNCEKPEEYGLGDDAVKLTIVYEEEEKVVSEETETETFADLETETESETEIEPQMVQRELTFYVGDTDENGNYYVQLEGSTQVHTVEATAMEAFVEIL